MADGTRREILDDTMTAAQHHTRWGPLITTLVLGPFCAELLTGNLPPREFVKPLIFVLSMLLYGPGVLLARELMVRWNKGWGTLLVLGLVYGIVEEGLVLQTFFNPAIGASTGGHIGRTNLFWAVIISTWHSGYSVAVVTIAVHAVFPGQREEAWLSRRLFVILCAGLFVAAGLMFYNLDSMSNGQYQTPWLDYGLTAAVAILLVIVARAFPHPLVRRAEEIEYTPRASTYYVRAVLLFLTGFLGMLAYYFVPGIIGERLQPPMPIMILVVCLTVLGVYVVVGLITRGGWRWTLFQQVATAGGAMTVYIAMYPLLSYLEGKDTWGMTVVRVFGVALILALLVRCARLERR